MAEEGSAGESVGFKDFKELEGSGGGTSEGPCSTRSVALIGSDGPAGFASACSSAPSPDGPGDSSWAVSSAGSCETI